MMELEPVLEGSWTEGQDIQDSSMEVSYCLQNKFSDD